jgi:hypothetical protein
MSEERKKNGPSHQVSFARITGRDDDGKDVLGPARQIGAIWPRANKDGEGILRLDHIPEELRSQGGGVVFVRKLDALRESRQHDKTHDKTRNRDRDRDR